MWRGAVANRLFPQDDSQFSATRTNFQEAFLGPQVPEHLSDEPAVVAHKHVHSLDVAAIMQSVQVFLGEGVQDLGLEVAIHSLLL